MITARGDATSVFGSKMVDQGCHENKTLASYCIFSFTQYFPVESTRQHLRSLLPSMWPIKFSFDVVYKSWQCMQLKVVQNAHAELKDHIWVINVRSNVMISTIISTDVVIGCKINGLAEIYGFIPSLCIGHAVLLSRCCHRWSGL